jgi:hypothetical protein
VSGVEVGFAGIWGERQRKRKWKKAVDGVGKVTKLSVTKLIVL